MPLTEEQAYYWSEEWQANERESLAELAAGNGLTFDDAEALIRWLTGDDNDALD